MIDILLWILLAPFWLVLHIRGVVVYWWARAWWKWQNCKDGK